MSESKAMKRLRKKLENEVLWIYICYILTSGEKTTHEIKSVLREKFGIKVSSIKLYSVLYRMEDEGLIKKIESDPIRYSLTSLGDIEYRKALIYLEEKLLLLKNQIGK
ncbi:MAG: hypothetical protein QW604_03860 [Fervidicoccaceae archaeon]